MIYEKMTAADVDRIARLYTDYYNQHEDGCWTHEKACRRIRQIDQVAITPADQPPVALQVAAMPFVGADYRSYFLRYGGFFCNEQSHFFTPRSIASFMSSSFSRTCF